MKRIFENTEVVIPRAAYNIIRREVCGKGEVDGGE
jgi:hypothetical protein